MLRGLCGFESKRRPSREFLLTAGMIAGQQRNAPDSQHCEITAYPRSYACGPSLAGSDQAAVTGVPVAEFLKLIHQGVEYVLAIVLNRIAAFAVAPS